MLISSATGLIEDDLRQRVPLDGRRRSLRSLDWNGQGGPPAFSKTPLPRALGYPLPPASLRSVVLAARLVDRHSDPATRALRAVPSSAAILCPPYWRQFAL